MSTRWFNVDHAGLTEIAKRRGMAFIVSEPVQNAWDEASSRVEVTLTPVPRAPRVDLVVRDDSPDGFQDLTDSHTLFRESKKLRDPEKRGRFNLGEKLLLAMADSARVTSTKGSVIFGPKGRTTGRKRTEAGTVLEARLRMTRQEMHEAIEFARRLLPPAHITTVVNGETLPTREPICSAERRLETEVRGAEGGFRYVQRKGTITLYEPAQGEQPSLYEMGIPIDTLDCPWHVDVGQKVPLSVDRGSVRYGFSLRVQRLAAEIAAERLTKEQARESWVSTALDGMEDDAAVRTVVEKRFGGKAVVYDPSNREANKLAIDAGFHVIKGGELSKSAWQTVRRARAVKPAGRVFGRGQRVSPDGKQAISETSWTDAMRRLAAYADLMACHVLGEDEGIEVAYYELGRNGTVACIGNGELSINLSYLRHEVEVGKQPDIDELLIHELAHIRGGGDHLADRYHRECCRIGAALRRPWFWTELHEC